MQIRGKGKVLFFNSLEVREKGKIIMDFPGGNMKLFTSLTESPEFLEGHQMFWIHETILPVLDELLDPHLEVLLVADVVH